MTMSHPLSLLGVVAARLVRVAMVPLMEDQMLTALVVRGPALVAHPLTMVWGPREDPGNLPLAVWAEMDDPEAH